MLHSPALRGAGVGFGTGLSPALSTGFFVSGGVTGFGAGLGLTTGRVTGEVGRGLGVGRGDGAGLTGLVPGCVGLGRGATGLTKLFSGSFSGNFETGRNLSKVSILPGRASGLLSTGGR